MRRAVALLFALLFVSAQVPAPVGGDMSNATTKVTGTSTARKLADRAADVINPLNFGAIADGTSHPLSTRYSTLAAAQAVCPEATALTQEIDWCAMQAALDYLATLSPIPANLFTVSGGAINVGSDMALYTGSTPLVSDNANLTLRGQDVQSSRIIVNADPWLTFGFNGKMGASFVNIASTGQGYVPNEILTLTGGTQTDPTNPTQAAQIQVLTIGPNGEILTFRIINGGNYAVVPTNPLAYASDGNGTDAQFTGTFTGTALTATKIGGTGSGCVNGEVLTLQGGVTPGGSPTPATFTVTNAIAGIIQANGLSVTNGGAYGTPPANPATTVGSASCTGALVNISGFSNSGYTLNMAHLRFSANAPGVSVVKAQLNTQARSVLIQDIKMDVPLANGYWRTGFDMTSLTNSIFRDIEGMNNQGQFVTHPGESMIIIREQNNLLGHFGYILDNINAYAWDGGALDMKATSYGIYQGIYITQGGCSLGNHCLRFENTTVHGYGYVRILDFYSSQTVRQIEMQNGLNVSVRGMGYGYGMTRESSLPAVVDSMSFTNVNQLMMSDNNCSISTQANGVGITQFNCIHLQGTSGNGTFHDNQFVNGSTVPMTGFLFDSATAGNSERYSRIFGPATNITLIADNAPSGKNTTSLQPPTSAPCVFHVLVAGETYTIPDYTACMYFNNGAIANATVIMPANNAAYQTINFTAFGSITTLTLQANTGQIMGAGMPTTLTNAAPFSVKNIQGRWQRV